MTNTWVARRAEGLFLMWVGMLAHAHPRTLKRTAHRLQELAEWYADLPFTGLLLEMRALTEHAIQRRTGSLGWTVARSRGDGRGRVRRGATRPRRFEINPEVRRALVDRLCCLPKPDDMGW